MAKKRPYNRKLRYQEKKRGVTLDKLKSRAYSKIAYWNKHVPPEQRLSYREYKIALTSMGVDTENPVELFKALADLHSYKDLQSYVPEPEYEEPEQPDDWFDDTDTDYFPALNNLTEEITGHPTEDLFKNWINQMVDIFGKSLVDEAIERAKEAGFEITRAENYSELASRKFMAEVNSILMYLQPFGMPDAKAEAFENAVATLNAEISVKESMQRDFQYNPKYERQRRYYERNRDRINARRRAKGR